MTKASEVKKARVYEVAKDLGMSSEAVLQIIRKLGVEVKNHMSTIAPEVVEKVRGQLNQSKAAVREEQHRKEEDAEKRAREERARAAAQAAAAAAAAKPAPPAKPAAPAAPAASAPAASSPPRPASALPASAPGPSRGPQPSSGGRPGGGFSPGGARPGSSFGSGGGGARPGSSFGSGGGGARPGPSFGSGPGGGRRRDKKKKKHVDEKLAAESVRKTLASLDTGAARRRHRRRDEDGVEVVTDDAKVIRATEFMTVAELANLMEVRPQEVIAACMRLGMLATINKRLDKDSISMVADEFGFGVEFAAAYGEEEVEETEEIAPEKLRSRSPVVTVMGHVDHGKTSLLDYVRRANVVAGESGGITQHIGAYEVTMPGGQRITFLDTPGHEAFTAMRARGAQVTDLVVLVVAADDRVMPQTIEAIDHAKAAGVPIVVAINKVDLPTADPTRIKTELAGHGVVVEEYGGKYVAVEISAKKGTNVEKLLEMILLTSELLELKADPDRRAKGVVLEARVEQGRGVVASVLVQQGTLQVGDAFVAGQHSGRVRAMFDERGRSVKVAPPSTPVEVLGWSGTPAAGDQFVAFDDEREAREIASKRAAQAREQEFRAAKTIHLSDVYSQMTQGELTELKLLIKGDVDGSVEALSESLQKLGNKEVAIRVIRQAVGQITESDVLLAAASGAIIVGFHVRPDARARELAEREHVEIRYYDIIYKAVEDVKSALEGLLKPEIKESVLGAAEVRQVFRISKAGMVAGCMVTNGNLVRTAKVRVLREGQTVWDGRMSALKRFKDDVKEVASGFECGISLDGFQDLKVGDVIEAYQLEEMARTL